jgi:hypothetical protein
MEPLDLGDLPEGVLVLIDSAPIVHVLKGHAELGSRFTPRRARWRSTLRLW